MLMYSRQEFEADLESRELQFLHGQTLGYDVVAIDYPGPTSDASVACADAAVY